MVPLPLGDASKFCRALSLRTSILNPKPYDDLQKASRRSGSAPAGRCKPRSVTQRASHISQSINPKPYYMPPLSFKYMNPIRAQVSGMVGDQVELVNNGVVILLAGESCKGMRHPKQKRDPKRVTVNVHLVGVMLRSNTNWHDAGRGGPPLQQRSHHSQQQLRSCSNRAAFHGSIRHNRIQRSWYRAPL